MCLTGSNWFKRAGVIESPLKSLRFESRGSKKSFQREGRWSRLQKCSGQEKRNGKDSTGLTCLLSPESRRKSARRPPRGFSFRRGVWAAKVTKQKVEAKKRLNLLVSLRKKSRCEKDA